MKKKVLGLLMAAVLCLCLLPVGAAVDGDVTVKYMTALMKQAATSSGAAAGAETALYLQHPIPM